jgi:hypothetical protein
VIVDRAKFESLLWDLYHQGASYDDMMKVLRNEFPNIITSVSVKCIGVDKETHELNFQVTVRV